MPFIVLTQVTYNKEGEVAFRNKKVVNTNKIVAVTVAGKMFKSEGMDQLFGTGSQCTWIHLEGENPSASHSQYLESVDAVVAKISASGVVVA